jgi:flagellar FliL protein
MRAKTGITAQIDCQCSQCQFQTCSSAPAQVQSSAMKLTYLKKIPCLLFLTILCLSCFVLNPAYANEGKSEGGGGLSAKLEPFTVNLLGADKYLQVGITLQLGNPETGEKIKMYMPVVRHVLILLLSNQEAATIQSASGKKHLIEEIKDSINKALKLDEHDGVTDTYFENFVIQ